VKKKEQKFVKFFGWPSKFDQWLDAKDVADINPLVNPSCKIFRHTNMPTKFGML